MTSIHSAVGIRSWQPGMSLPNRHWIFPRRKQKQNKKWRDVLTVLFSSSIVHTTSVCFEIFTAAFGSWARTALIVRTAKSEIQWMQTTLGRYPVQQTLRMRVCDCRALRKLSKRFSGAGGERLRGVCVWEVVLGILKDAWYILYASATTNIHRDVLHFFDFFLNFFF